MPTARRSRRRSTGSRRRGKVALKDADREHRWYSDYPRVPGAGAGSSRRFLTPARDGGGDPEQPLGHAADLRASTRSRPSTASPTGTRGRSRSSGSGRSSSPTNEAARQRAARAARGWCDLRLRALRARPRRRHLLDRHGADAPDGRAAASRRPAASTTSATATRRRWSRSSAACEGIEGPDGYVFFAADSRHPDYELIRNVVNSQNYVSQFELRGLPGRAPRTSCTPARPRSMPR